METISITLRNKTYDIIEGTRLTMINDEFVRVIEHKGEGRSGHKFLVERDGGERTTIYQKYIKDVIGVEANTPDVIGEVLPVEDENILKEMDALLDDMEKGEVIENESVTDSPMTIEVEEVVNREIMPDFSAIPQLALLEIAKVASLDSKKYGEFAYSDGTVNRWHVSEAMLDLNKYLRSDDVDENGLHNLANAAFQIMAVLDKVLLNQIKDDRNTSYK